MDDDKEAASPSIRVRRLVRSLAESCHLETRQLDTARLHVLKQLIRNDDQDGGLIETFVSALFDVLHRECADVRFGALKICQQFFVRSHRFRQLLTDDFQDFLLLTAETDPLHFPLPQPKAVALALKAETLKSVKSWHDKYGPAYAKLQLAYTFLKDCKSMDFERMQALTRVEQQEEAQKQRRVGRIRDKLTTTIQREYGEISEDVDRCLIEMESGIQLLIPDFRAHDDQDHVLSSPDGSTDQLRSHGIPCSSSTGAAADVEIRVDLSKSAVQVSADNQVVIEALFDCANLLENRFLKSVSKWLQLLTKYSHPSNETLIKTLIDCKHQCSSSLERYKRLRIPDNYKLLSSHRELSDDSDMEDVPEKEGLQLSPLKDDSVPAHILAHCSTVSANDVVGNLPSVSSDNVGTAHGVHNKAKTKVLPYDLDLKYWGTSRVDVAGPPRNDLDCNNYWKPPDQEIQNERSVGGCTADELLVPYKARLIEFSGHFVPVERGCGAVLNDGVTHCQRKDRRRCPLHGHIDQTADTSMEPGPSSRVDNLAVSKRASSKEGHYREDAGLLEDIELATGVPLKSGRTRTGNRLSNKRQKPASVQRRERLERQLFDQKTIKRVAAVLADIQEKKNQKLYHQNFNYALRK